MYERRLLKRLKSYLGFKARHKNLFFHLFVKGERKWSEKILEYF